MFLIILMNLTIVKVFLNKFFLTFIRCIKYNKYEGKLTNTPSKGDTMKNMTARPEEYVDSREGAELLGVDTGNFFYYVQSGQIAKEPDSPKRNARYSVADILKVK